MATRLVEGPFVTADVGNTPEGLPIVGGAGSGDVSGSVSTMVDAHGALATGVHGVGASTVESAAGAQAKATAAQAAAEATAAGALATHVGAADPHSTAGYARKSVVNAFSQSQQISRGANATVEWAVENPTDGAASLVRYWLRSDPNAAAAVRSAWLALYAESHGTAGLAGAAAVLTSNVRRLLLGTDKGSTTGDEEIALGFGAAAATTMLHLLRRVTTSRKIASFFSAAPPDTGGDGAVFVGNATAEPTADAAGAWLWALAGELHTHVLHVKGAGYFDSDVTIVGQFEAEGGLFAGDVVFNGTVTVLAETHVSAQMIVGADAAPAATAALEVRSTTGGLLLPRMTTTQRDALTTPPDGLVIYNTTTNKVQARAAGAWVDLH